MSALLHLQHISKTFGLHTVLNDISLSLHPGERVGLVGANGVGKSTLLKIIAGEVVPDGGDVTRAPSLQVGYLRQVILGHDARTVAELRSDAAPDLRQIETDLRRIEAGMARASGDLLAALLTQYGDLTETFERRGGYDLDHQLEAIIDGLGIAHLDRTRAFGTLSGGEKARVGLALLLMESPDVLLLDEPTNHLDFRSVDWLEGYLSVFRGGALIVSHDRHFLNRTVSAIIEIDEHTRAAKRYAGDYEAYRAAKALERVKWRADYAAEQEEIKRLRLEAAETARRNENYRTHRDNDKFVVNLKKATHEGTVSKRIRVAEEHLSRILDHPIPEPPDDLHFAPAVNIQTLSARLPLRVEHISKYYAGRAILDDVSFDVPRAARIVFVGANGAGKSTLLNILIGATAPDSGRVSVNPAVNVGILAQEQRVPDAWRGLTLFEAFKDGLHEDAKVLQAMVIKSDLFRYTDFDKPVASLSSGELRKLHIARLIAACANVLILDEPTNDISLDVLDGLERALQTFPGAVIAASHDRYFIAHMAQMPGGMVWEVRDGALWQTSAAQYANGRMPV
ncbi:MAG: ABC-F family ATP-binding cassette domain-containing protein [Chloroflexota bacterium]|nr:ABC-F family ATP-binding cassette domain-containing protein [Chloroflexota bacterium]